jgi:hypothetical protein
MDRSRPAEKNLEGRAHIFEFTLGGSMGHIVLRVLAIAISVLDAGVSSV